MKKIWIIALIFVTGLVVMNDSANAQPLKIGFVDLQRALNESESGKKAISNLESFIKPKQAKMDEKRKAIEAMKAEHEKKASVLSEDAKQKKQEEINKMLREYNRALSDLREDFVKRETELTKELLKEIKVIINDIAKEEKFSVIMQNIEVIPLHNHVRGSKGNSVVISTPVEFILYASGEVDITNVVIKKYDESKNKKN